jgi:hypothetical protein
VFFSVLSSVLSAVKKKPKLRLKNTDYYPLACKTSAKVACKLILFLRCELKRILKKILLYLVIIVGCTGLLAGAAIWLVITVFPSFNLDLGNLGAVGGAALLAVILFVTFIELIGESE